MSKGDSFPNATNYCDFSYLSKNSLLKKSLAIVTKDEYKISKANANQLYN